MSGQPQLGLLSLAHQVLQTLPAQGEPLIYLAHDLGLRVLNRHLVKQKQATKHVQKLGQQYSQYLRLLASDTQVKWGGLPPGSGTSLRESLPCALHLTAYMLHLQPSSITLIRHPCLQYISPAEPQFPLLENVGRQRQVEL